MLQNAIMVVMSVLANGERWRAAGGAEWIARSQTSQDDRRARAQRSTHTQTCLCGREARLLVHDHDGGAPHAARHG